jgi:hypothetical protein
VVMSESTAWDERRVFWKEWIKSRLVKMCVAGLAGGTPHADYLAQLGLPRDRIFKGYDIVDNDYFAAGRRSQKSGIRNQKVSLACRENIFWRARVSLRRKIFSGSSRRMRGIVNSRRNQKSETRNRRFGI